MGNNKYYNTKWSNVKKEDRFIISKRSENKLAEFLINKCGFKHIIPTRDSIVTMAKENGIILPDLQGVHKSSDVYFIELKDKNRRMEYADNGIDYDKAEAYLKAQKQFGFRVLVVFIDNEDEWIQYKPTVKSLFKDENNNCVYYGNWIDKLYAETPDNAVTITMGAGGKRVKCFPLRNMKKIEDIFKEKQTRLNFGVLK